VRWHDEDISPGIYVSNGLIRSLRRRVSLRSAYAVGRHPWFADSGDGGVLRARVTHSGDRSGAVASSRASVTVRCYHYPRSTAQHLQIQVDGFVAILDKEHEHPT
jgi:hypothetical protein